MDTNNKSSADVVQKPVKGNWIGRHWRGELSLGISYWLNGLLVNLAILILGGSVAVLISSYDPQKTFISIAIVWGGGLLAEIWLVVGIWRSAVQHPTRGGKRFWSVVARVMCVISGLQFFNMLHNTAWPQLHETYKIIAGDDELQEHAFRFLNNGTELEFKGWITFGIADELEKLLDAAPAVRVIHLQSNGGRIHEAEKLRDLIRARRLTTYVTNECVSACTIVFLGGSQRLLRPRTGKLGFHQPSFPGVSAEDLKSPRQQIIDDAVLAGVKRSFMEKAYATDTSTLWYPTTEEAIDAGYVTGVSAGQFALPGVDTLVTQENMAAVLRKTPLYDAIARAEPALFGRIIDRFMDTAVQGLPESELSQPLQRTFYNLLPKYLPHASDEAILAMEQVLVEKLQALSKADPVLCHDYLFPTPETTTDFQAYFDPSLQERSKAAVETVLLTAINDPKAVVAGAKFDQSLQDLTKRISQRHGQETVQRIQEMKSGTNKSLSCSLTIMLYSEVLLMPRSQATLILRNIFSQSKL